MRISDWSSDVCSSDLDVRHRYPLGATGTQAWRSAGSEPAQLRARTLGVGGRQALRRRRYLGIPRVSIRAQEGRVDSSRGPAIRSEEHTSELQSLMRISYAVFCLKKKNQQTMTTNANNIIKGHVITERKRTDVNS